MAIPEAATYHPLSDAHFTPTLAYYIQPTKSSTKPVLNLTTQLLPLPDPSTSAPPTFIPEDVLARAKSIATCSTAAQTLIYVLHKDNLLGTHYTAQDRDGIQIAESQGGIIDWGRTTFKFPDGSQHGEGFEMKTVAFGRKAKTFVKDGLNYTWDVEKSHHEHKILVKKVGDETVEVARWSQKHGYDRDGLLLIDEKQVDDLVVVLTICAVLEVNDSFTK